METVRQKVLTGKARRRRAAPVWGRRHERYMAAEHLKRDRKKSAAPPHREAALSLAVIEPEALHLYFLQNVTDGVGGAFFDTLTAVDTGILVYHRQILIHMNGLDRTGLGTFLTADTADGTAFAGDTALVVVLA